MLKAYGYTREQLLGMTIDQIRPTEDLDRFRRFINSDHRFNTATSTWRHLRNDGTLMDVEIESTSVVFRGEQARLVAARNVTGFCDTVEKYNLALSAGNFAIWEYIIADGTLHWDPGHSGVYGIDRSFFPVDKQQFLSMVAPEFRESMEEAFCKCVNDGAPYDCEFRIAMPVLGMRWRHAVGKRVQDQAGTPVKIIGIGIDITARKNLEEQLHRSQKLEAVGRLASGIAHDFNNILTVISGYSYLLKSEKLPDYLVDSASEIGTATDRAARLVKQLLEFSRTVPVAPELMEINDVISKTLVLIRRLLPETIRVSLDQSVTPIVLRADPGQIEQLVMNICLNARDAMGDGGVLTVCVSNEANTFVCISFEDTGSGITPEVQERIFEPFFTTKEVGSGSGLGLSIVHGIVKQLNGSVEVESLPGLGSKFVIKLPLANT